MGVERYTEAAKALVGDREWCTLVGELTDRTSRHTALMAARLGVGRLVL